ncbi:DUF1214 domain-containing protein [Flavobacterium sp. MMLR14_040]|uniref:DUF1254 domain-containing protein n=1 Tax=Flavobacterium sp. MMLR14_040 TaxID=3093843 RepID=UPI00298F661A|nr:DUF1214 domain-containing protein [Flavobacterium sp. MMLR14_040]MDW8850794.1 DUF1214 domain-containing protein [Flavobacterium sp. MMLR14_040]
MKICKIPVLVPFFFIILNFGTPILAQEKKLSSDQIKEERAYATGIQALLWGRPLVEYATTIYNGVKAGAGYMNYWHKFDKLKTAADRYVVTPNNVTIDGYGNADLSIEPVVINIPATQEDRWYIVQIGNMFDEVVYNIGGYKGKETGLFIITGPDYNGKIPFGMKEIKVNTKLAIVAMRIFVKGETDLNNARELQKGFHMMPLSVFQIHGLKYEMPKTFSFTQFTPSAPQNIQSFEHLGFAMKLFLSANEDYSDSMISSFKQIGLSVSKGFEWQTLDEPTKKGLAKSVAAAEQIIDDAYQNSAVTINGWRYSMAGGRGGYDFALRSAFAKYLLGANVSEQLFYPNTKVDKENQPLSGKNKYVLHFEKAEIPPVSVFWNMAMYDEKELFIENDFKRYTIGSTTDGLKQNTDGSIDLYIQKDNPGKDKESNWLPAPAGSFNLTMRMYGASTAVLDGTYSLPAVKKVN